MQIRVSSLPPLLQSKITLGMPTVMLPRCGACHKSHDAVALLIELISSSSGVVVVATNETLSINITG